MILKLKNVNSINIKSYFNKSFEKDLEIDSLLLDDVFVNFKNICLKIYELDPAKFRSAPGLAWQVALKQTKIKLEF